MRKIAKHQIPECLQTFVEGQLAIHPEPINLTYKQFRDNAELLAILTDEQFGLCGYTGIALDKDRIAGLSSPSGRATFRNHIEHLKCQELCKSELAQEGGKYGRDLCDDLNYYNMIAAIEVSGSEPEHFGAVKKKNKYLPVHPIQDGCDESFRFNENDGSVAGLNHDAQQTIGVLDLNNDTLKGWRKAAINEWLDPEIIKTIEDFESIKQAVELPFEGKLPEYAFVIGSIIKEYLR